MNNVEIYKIKNKRCGADGAGGAGGAIALTAAPPWDPRTMLRASSSASELTTKPRALLSGVRAAHGGRTASRHAAFGASSLTSPTAYEAATAGVLGRGGGRVGTRGAGPPA